MNNSSDHAFQFHCMICYDEFENTASQYPVVLPCGHTYVCKKCSDKLDKCMECREPLYTSIEQETIINQQPSVASVAPQLSASRSSWSSARSSSSVAAAYGNTRTTQSAKSKAYRDTKSIKKRLPLPKNVVLLSLIDATKMISGDAQPMLTVNDGEEESVSSSKVTGLALSKLDTSATMEDEEDENQRANFATSISAGIAGTYAVAAEEGLQIFPTRPASMTRSTSSMTDDDVESLVQFFHSDKMSKDLGVQNISSSHDSAEATKHDSHMATLAFGDRIQVVSMDRGWAKLARGYGYVRADKNQIVKVMNALDRACILEAMLRTLSAERRHLRMKQSENDTQFVRLMNQLRVSLQNDEDFTVVCRTAFDENEEGGDNVDPEDSPTEKKEGEHTRWDFSRESTPVSNFPKTLTPIEPNLPMCNNGFFANTRLPSPSPNVIRAGAQAWRERQAREVQKSINFRSGLSGHMALASNRAHPHELLSVTSGEKKVHNKVIPPSSGQKVTNFRMSSHSGLTLSNRKKKPSSSGRSKNLESIKLAESM